MAVSFRGCSRAPGAVVLLLALSAEACSNAVRPPVDDAEDVVWGVALHAGVRLFDENPAAESGRIAEMLADDLAFTGQQLGLSSAAATPARVIARTPSTVNALVGHRDSYRVYSDRKTIVVALPGPLPLDLAVRTAAFRYTMESAWGLPRNPHSLIPRAIVSYSAGPCAGRSFGTLARRVASGPGLSELDAILAWAPEEAPLSAVVSGLALVEMLERELGPDALVILWEEGVEGVVRHYGINVDDRWGGEIRRLSMPRADTPELWDESGSICT